MKKKDDVEPSKDNIKNHPNVISCQVYDRDGETISFNDPNNLNQVEKTRLNELNGKSEKVQYIKIDLVEYIKERSKEKQQISSNIIHKNQKVLDVLVHRNKDTFLNSRLVTFKMKNISQQLENSTSERKKFRSKSNEGRELGEITR